MDHVTLVVGAVIEILFIIICTVQGQYVEFSNITDIMNLSSLYVDVNLPDQYSWKNGECYVTDYVDNSLQSSYHWLSQSIWALGNPPPPQYNYEACNIYDDYLIQYNNELNNISDQLPFNYHKSTYQWAICSSPKTKDIMECYIQMAEPSMQQFVYWIECHIFYNNNAESSYWSRPVIVSGPIDSTSHFGGVQILCFDDSYFILYSSWFIDNSYFYSLLDLHNNLIQEKIKFYPYSFENTNNKRFVLSKNNHDNTFLFQQYYTNSTGGIYPNISTWFNNIICKYTNINDKNPIKIIYNKRFLMNDLAQYKNYQIEYLLISGSITVYLHSSLFKSDCCYVTTNYLKFGNSFWKGYFLMIDFNGNIIGNATFIENEDIYDNYIQSLASISNYQKQYFIIFYNTIRTNEVQSDTVGTVYYINNNKQLFELNTYTFMNKSNHDNEMYGYLNGICSNVIANDKNMLLVQPRSSGVFAQIYKLRVTD